MSHLPLSFMDRLNQTESAVFKAWFPKLLAKCSAFNVRQNIYYIVRLCCMPIQRYVFCLCLYLYFVLMSFRWHCLLYITIHCVTTLLVFFHEVVFCQPSIFRSSRKYSLAIHKPEKHNKFGSNHLSTICMACHFDDVNVSLKLFWKWCSEQLYLYRTLKL